ncbi:2-dehydropantoate 2-reductase [Butyrivibrio sp. CB08]|uniref:5' nucleotidase, NT5C type n=1 Tax=Butyrivibrio sp. CB08 TaxID=2364879 RepID=UPI000EAA8B23|nr:2-dehydropantoate 2-reductase [Butyrivibrio sp. CB08]RKM59209.1 2-dehydropantoate 2-reductase [Butyrivibrio sp. CB08]
MKIYIDFDDCLSETAKTIVDCAHKMFGSTVTYNEFYFFDIAKTFNLSPEDYDRLMHEVHRPEVLLSYDEAPGASETVNGWLDQGHEVSIITGRPYNTYEPSRRWLDEHGLDRVPLYFLNKYGRDFFYEDSEYNLELEDYYKMHFDYAIEDSPKAFKFFEHLPDLKVMLFDRPWNRDCELPGDNFTRSPDWKFIKEHVI